MAETPTIQTDLASPTYTTVGAIAEIILARLEPEMKDLGAYEIEDIFEDVRNAYSGVVWKIYLQAMDSDGDRLIIDSLLERKRFETTGEPVILKGLGVIALPRDAGIYQVIPFDKDNNAMEPLTKTNAAQAYAPPPRINSGYTYYRIGDTMYFPKGLPPCSVGVEVLYLGMEDADPGLQKIPREYGDMVRDKVWQSLFPSKNVRADVTNNKNPNE